MNKQTIIINYDKNDWVSSFAFSLGKTIENIISVETDNLQSKNQKLEGLILSYFIKLEGGEKTRFSEYFGIEAKRKGKL